MKKPYLYVVTFYKGDGEFDWETLIATSFSGAIACVKKTLREQYGLDKSERLDCSEFDAFMINDAFSYSGRRYQVQVKGDKK